jgi:hypothetical protein
VFWNKWFFFTFYPFHDHVHDRAENPEGLCSVLQRYKLLRNFCAYRYISVSVLPIEQKAWGIEQFWKVETEKREVPYIRYSDFYDVFYNTKYNSSFRNNTDIIGWQCQTIYDRSIRKTRATTPLTLILVDTNILRFVFITFQVIIIYASNN